MTEIKTWIDYLITLKKNNFSDEELLEISSVTSELTEALLETFDEDIDVFLEDWFEGILTLKKNGFTTELILTFISDIKDAYVYSERYYNDDDDEDDEYDDDDDDDDDDDFDPNKFFPRR